MDGPRAAAVCKGQGWPGRGMLELELVGPAVGHCGACENKPGSWMSSCLFVCPCVEMVVLFLEISFAKSFPDILKTIR